MARGATRVMANTAGRNRGRKSKSGVHSELDDEEKKKRERERAERKRQKELMVKRSTAKPLPVAFLIEHIERSVRSKYLMRDLTVYIPFVFAFVFIVVRGRSALYWTSQGIFNKVGGNEIPGTQENGPYFDKVFFDSQIPSDIYDWWEGVVVGNLWDTENQTASGLNYVIGSNYGLGTVKFRMLKVLPHTCQGANHFYPDAPTPPSNTTTPFPNICWAAYKDSLVDQRPFGRPSQPNETVPIWETPGNRFQFEECDLPLRTSGLITSYPCSGYSIEVPFSASMEEAINKVAELRENNFLEQWGLRFAVVEFFLYNVASEQFTSVKFFYEFTSGGALVGTSRVRGFVVWTKADMVSTLLEIFFLLFVLHYCGKFINDLRLHKRNNKGSYIGYFFHFWNTLELVNLLAFILTFMFRALWWKESATELDLPWPNTFPEKLDKLKVVFYGQVWFNALNTVVTFLKLLKFVRLNDQLNILSRTMHASAGNIMGTLLIFTLTVVAFTITGTSLFGAALEDYRNINTAFSTMGRILVGDFDYVAMRNEDPLFAGIYFWAYTILALFLLLNFLIAIIGEAFSKENEKTKTNPLAAQLRRKFHKLHKRLLHGKQCERIMDILRRRSKRLPQATVLQYLLEYQFTVTAAWRLTQRQTLARIAADHARKHFHADKEHHHPHLHKHHHDDESPKKVQHEEPKKNFFKKLFNRRKVADNKHADDDSDTSSTRAALLEGMTPPEFTVTRLHLQELIPASEYRDIGEDFFDDLWDNITYDYDLHNKDEEAEAQKEEQQLYEQVLKGVLKNLLPNKEPNDEEVDVQMEEKMMNRLVDEGKESYLQGQDETKPNKGYVLKLFKPTTVSESKLANIEHHCRAVYTNCTYLSRVTCVVENKLNLLNVEVNERHTQHQHQQHTAHHHNASKVPKS